MVSVDEGLATYLEYQCMEARLPCVCGLLFFSVCGLLLCFCLRATRHPMGLAACLAVRLWAEG